MREYSFNKKESNKDHLKSGLITAIIWTGILLFVFFYTIKSTSFKEKEVVSTMLVNFGDNRNGDGLEEPANQEGSVAMQTETSIPEEAISTPQPEPKVEPVVEKTPVKEKKEPSPEKILSGNDSKVSVPEKSKTLTPKKTETKTANTSSKNTATKSETGKSTAESGDGKGVAAIGNLMKGRGSKTGSQGNGGTTGNGNRS